MHRFVTLITHVADKAEDLLLIRKFVRRMKGGKRKILNSLNFGKEANLGLYVGNLRYFGDG